MAPKNELVFKEEKGLKSDLFTTSKVISETVGIKHHAVTRLIRRHDESFQTFGKVGFKIQALPSGQKEKIYILNEQQATLMMTMLKNTPEVLGFKRELIRQFYQMKEELYLRKSAYQDSKETQKDLHFVINTSVAYKDSENKKFMYVNFNKLLLETATGEKLKDIKNRGQAETMKALLSPQEIQKHTQLEKIIITLLQAGADYSVIKETLRKIA